MPRIHASVAHMALNALLDELGQLSEANKAELTARSPRGGSTKTAAQWEDLLRTTAREIKEWCPDPPFVFDIPKNK